MLVLDMLAGKRLLPWRRAFLVKFCRTVLPGPGDGLPDWETMGTVGDVERYVAGLHPLLRLGLMGLFDLLNILALFRFLRPMTWLNDSQAHHYVAFLEKHPLYELRNAFVAAKALVMLVYYGDPRLERATGYLDDCLAEPQATGVER